LVRAPLQTVCHRSGALGVWALRVRQLTLVPVEELLPHIVGLLQISPP
jgi:hypothetical protein